MYNILLEYIMDSFISYRYREGYFYNHIVVFDTDKTAYISFYSYEIDDIKVYYKERNNEVFISMNPRYPSDFKQWLRLISA